ncbi:MAG: PTS sugar transporter subunit IIA [Spirochaetia bacterium]
MAKNTKDEVPTLSEIASYLKVSDKTILRMAQAGEIPSAKVSGQWRFLRSFINDWLETKMHIASTESLGRVVGTAETVIPLSRLISPEWTLMDLQPGSKEQILRQLVRPLSEGGIVADADGYYEQLLRREEMVSTALGRGIAFPHVRHPDQAPVRSPVIVLGICRPGTDFNSLDGNPTHVFGLCCSSSEAMHLRLLAKMTLVFRSDGMVDRLRDANDAKEVTRLLIAADWELSISMQKRWNK